MNPQVSSLKNMRFETWLLGRLVVTTDFSEINGRGKLRTVSLSEQDYYSFLRSADLTKVLRAGVDFLTIVVGFLLVEEVTRN